MFSPMDFRRAIIKRLDRLDPPPVGAREEAPPAIKVPGRNCFHCGAWFRPRTREIACQEPGCQKAFATRRRAQKQAWRRKQREERRKGKR